MVVLCVVHLLIGAGLLLNVRDAAYRAYAFLMDRSPSGVGAGLVG
ncbi:hypothetical protein [Streptomyces sp. SID8014]|nr:hypothetical protein [Streptomyces sp. SID8014]